MLLSNVGYWYWWSIFDTRSTESTVWFLCSQRWEQSQNPSVWRKWTSEDTRARLVHLRFVLQHYIFSWHILSKRYEIEYIVTQIMWSRLASFKISYHCKPGKLQANVATRSSVHCVFRRNLDLLTRLRISGGCSYGYCCWLWHSCSFGEATQCSNLADVLEVEVLITFLIVTEGIRLVNADCSITIPSVTWNNHAYTAVHNVKKDHLIDKGVKHRHTCVVGSTHVLHSLKQFNNSDDNSDSTRVHARCTKWTIAIQRGKPCK